ncbi:hypothetical protein [Paenibacillus donghaensis]|uniref:hypothetical protein n=1 Tax=Paenibacillus donghaensis TaxID=414771 RepID=UPI0014723FEA|nr:hypothetical protein [Paenibacillus donghaensis]
MADGILTQAEYTEQQTALAARATSLVNGTLTGKEGRSGIRGDKDLRGKSAGGTSTSSGTTSAE